MIGLPYPNKKSVELQEKMNYLNQNMASNPFYISFIFVFFLF